MKFDSEKFEIYFKRIRRKQVEIRGLEIFERSGQEIWNFGLRFSLYYYISTFVDGYADVTSDSFLLLEM